MKSIHFVETTFVLLLCAFSVNAQIYKVAQEGTATTKNKKVLLLLNSTDQKKIILFQTDLYVNTDGSPLSYHPQDPRANRNMALNNICNAIAVRKGSAVENLCLRKPTFGEAIGVFERWRDSNYQTDPPGYRITWKNVLALDKAKDIPCTFKTGPYRGYFGSLTSLKNGLVGNKGECEIDDQLNAVSVPALVLLKGQNIVWRFGARQGDLLVAYNPKTQLVVSAIIGDTGPEDNLGEGSIYLNMRLLGRTVPPTNKSKTDELSIEDKILVAIIPASLLFEIKGNKPYTAENIDRRVRHWQETAGFPTPEKFLELMKSFQSKLD